MTPTACDQCQETRRGECIGCRKPACTTCDKCPDCRKIVCMACFAEMPRICCAGGEVAV